MGTTILNGVLALVSIITYMFVIQDIEQQILESTAAYPWVAVFAIATGSNAGAIGMTIPFIVISFGPYPGLMHTSGIGPYSPLPQA